jgi:RNA-directed DNA polymerase
MNAYGESDDRVVPLRSANKGVPETPAESAEERRSAKKNTPQSNLDRTQSREKRRSSGLAGVRERAHQSPDLKFTSLLHHVDVALLRESFYKLKKSAAVGVDGVTWKQYEADLENHLVDLHGRIHRGAYRAKPSKRVYIEKADGKQRPLGIPSLEDKIAQHAVRMVLESIYENDFLGFSYGFRPSRSQYQALDALYVGITEKRVNWVLDADIQGFFDQIDRDWLVKFIEHRIGDTRIVRLIQKWLNAGIIEDTEWSDTGKGTPQGAVLSPLLANVFLHYVLDVRPNGSSIQPSCSTTQDHSAMARCQTSRPIRGKSRMSESLTYGSVRGAAGDGGPYRDYSKRLLLLVAADDESTTLRGGR